MQESALFPTSSGNRPYISERSVRAALRSLLYVDPDKPLPPNPLWHLTIIEQLMHDPTLPRVEKVRHQLLKHILVEEIEAAVAQVRHANHVPPPRLGWTRDDVLADLRQIARSENAELKAWAILYARYVLFNASVALDEMASALGAEERSRRRWEKHGISRMVDRLMAREWAARQSDKRYRLVARLPGGAPGKVYGREGWLEHALSLVKEGRQTILVTGESGIGKRTVVRSLIDTLIDEERIDQLLWLENPSSAESIALWIQEVVSQEPAPRFALERYLEEHHFVLVIHQITRLLEDRNALEQLLVQLGRVTVILIHDEPTVLDGITAHLEVPALAEEFIVVLARVFWDRFQKQQLTPEIIGELIQASHGNPALLKSVIQGFGRGWREASGGLGRLITRLSPAAWDALVICLFSPVEGVVVDDAAWVWGERLTHEGVQELLTHTVVEHDPMTQRVSLVPAWREALIDDYQAHGLSFQAALAGLAHLDEVARTHPKQVVITLETLLNSEWFQLDPVRRRHWLASGWRAGVLLGRSTAWLEMLRAATRGVLHDDALLWMALGVCARRQMLWEECGEALQAAIALAGERGNFALQTEALLERAILLRLLNHLGRAADEFATVRRRAGQYKLPKLTERVVIEMAQLALEQDDAAAAELLLQPLDATLVVTLLRAEAWCKLEDVDRCQAGIVMLQSAEILDPTLRARYHDLLGQWYRRMGDKAAACRERETVVTILEQTDDEYGKGRAYGNLATALLETGGSRREIVRLYRLAEAFQRKSGDVVGLFATTHNLNIVHLTD
jgi:tetratricopeptide (TPR) repeat protein